MPVQRAATARRWSQEECVPEITRERARRREERDSNKLDEWTDAGVNGISLSAEG